MIPIEDDRVIYDTFNLDMRYGLWTGEGFAAGKDSPAWQLLPEADKKFRFVDDFDEVSRTHDNAYNDAQDIFLSRDLGVVSNAQAAINYLNALTAADAAFVRDAQTANASKYPVWGNELRLIGAVAMATKQQSQVELVAQLSNPDSEIAQKFNNKPDGMTDDQFKEELKSFLSNPFSNWTSGVQTKPQMAAQAITGIVAIIAGTPITVFSGFIESVYKSIINIFNFGDGAGTTPTSVKEGEFVEHAIGCLLNYFEVTEQQVFSNKSYDADTGTLTYAFAYNEGVPEFRIDTGGRDDGSVAVLNNDGIWINVAANGEIDANVASSGESDIYTLVGDYFTKSTDDDGTDTLFGGDGVDQLVATNVTDALTFSWDNASSAFMIADGSSNVSLAAKDFETIIGTSGEDTLSLALAESAITVSLGLSDSSFLITGGGVSGEGGGGIEISSIESLVGTGQSDTLDLSNATTGVTFNLNQLVESSGDVVLQATGFEVIVGSSLNDIITAGGTNGFTIDAGSGDDTLIGGGGIDTLIGGAGADTIKNAGPGSIIYGGSDADTIYLADDALVADAQSEDRIYYAGRAVTGAIGWGGSESAWVTSGDGVKYGIDTAGELQIKVADGRRMFVAGYQGGPGAAYNTAGIYIGRGEVHAWQLLGSKRPNLQGAYTKFSEVAGGVIKAATGYDPFTGKDPLVLDLDGDGLELSARSSASVKFDMDGDGFAEPTAWVYGGDGLLALDANGNGAVDDISELFGGNGASGFGELAAFDVNADQRIDLNDAVWSELKVWKDANADGVTDAGELLGMEMAGIAAVDLASVAASTQILSGNPLASTGSFIRDDGTSGLMADAALLSDDFNSRWLGDATVNAEAMALPGIKGHGTLTDLRVAMTLDVGLAATVANLLPALSSHDLAELRVAATPILAAWASSVPVRSPDGTLSTVDPSTRPDLPILVDATGHVIDYAYPFSGASGSGWKLGSDAAAVFSTIDQVLAQSSPDGSWMTFNGAQIGFLERYFGQELPLDDVPLNPAGVTAKLGDLLDSFKGALDMVTVRLAVQGPLAGYFPGVVYDGASDNFVPTTDRQLIPSFEAIFQAAPADAGGTLAWLESWKPFLDVVLGDFDRGASHLVVSQNYMFSNIVAAYESVRPAAGIVEIAGALGVPKDHILTGSGDIAGTDGDDMIYVSGGDQTIVGGLGSDSYIVGGNFGHDVIVDIEPIGSGHESDVLRFATVRSSEVTARREGIDLIITVDATGDELRIAKEFEGIKPSLFGGDLSDDTGVNEIIFADGVVWDTVDMALAASHPLASDDTITGTTMTDFLDGGAGNDTLVGSDSGDVYSFGSGYGNDIIVEAMENILIEGDDVLMFGNGITKNDLQFSHIPDTDDLMITIKDTGDTLKLVNQFAVAYTLFGKIWFNRVEEFVFRDGTSLLWDDVIRDINATAGTDANDVIYGFSFEDTLSGGRGDDFLSGGNENDVYLFGLGDGHDTIKEKQDNFKSGGMDSVRFGAGVAPSDIVFERIGSSDNLDLLLPDGSRLTLEGQFSRYVTLFGELWLDRVEYFEFTDAPEFFWNADEVMDMLTDQHSTDGNDSIYGYAREDTLSGGAGNDFLAGGEESDTYLFNLGDGQDIIDENSSSIYAGDADRIVFGAGISPDAIVVSQNADKDIILSIAGTTDSIRIIEPYSTLHGLDLGEIEIVKFFDGTVWTEADILRRALTGTAGNDLLQGYHMNDTLDGGAGNDTLIGTQGDDTYIFKAGYGSDVISDQYALLLDSNDVVIFGDGIIAADLQLSRAGNDLIINFADSTDVLRIANQFDWLGSGTIEVFRFEDGTTWDNNQVFDEYLAQATTDGDDLILGTYGPETLYGAAGNDTLIADSATDYLFGGDGDDTLSGEEGSDFIVGGHGNDSIIGGTGSDTFVFSLGDGQDSLRYANSDMDVIQFGEGVLPSNIVVTRPTERSFEISIEGTSDKILVTGYYGGGEGNDFLRFADGASWTVLDVIAKATTGTSGDDTLYGSNGSDTLDGGFGDDLLNGSAGNDAYLYGRDYGFDIIQDASSSVGDVIILGDGILPEEVQLVRTGVSGDLILSVNGSTGSLLVDRQFGSWTVEEIHFSNSVVWDTSAITLIAMRGTQQNDSLFGTSGGDILDGGAGNDYLEGLDGDDIYIFGQGYGQDRIRDANGLDAVHFGEGVLTSDMVFSRAGSGNNDLVAKIRDTTDQLTVTNYFANSASRIESFAFVDGSILGHSDIQSLILLPTTGDDILVGSDFADSISGLGGNDTIDGLGGNDTLDGSAGSDFIDGGNDADILYGKDNDDTLIGGDGSDTLDGGLGNDTLTGGQGNDTLLGKDGNDAYILNYGDGNDSLTENKGTDTLFIGTTHEHVQFFRSANDLIISLDDGTSLSVYLNYNNPSVFQLENVVFSDGETLNIANGLTFTGTSSGELVSGWNYDDTLIGGDGSDTLDGGLGNDTLTGGQGNDTLLGKDGNDVYILNYGDGNDSLTENKGIDTLFIGTTQDHVQFFRSSSDLVITLDDGTSLSVYLNYNNPTVFQLENVVFSDGATLNIARGLTFTGTSAGELVRGWNYDDILIGGDGADTLDGGTGNDTASYTGSLVGVTVSLAANTAIGGDAYGDRFTSIESLSGSDFGDTLIGNSGANMLFGASGSDWLDGLGGFDTASYTGAYASYQVSRQSGTVAVVEGVSGDTDILTNIEALAFSDITLRLDGVNNAPFLGNDSLRARANQSLLIAQAELLANDSDFDGNALTITSVSSAIHGTVALGVDGVIDFIPETQYVGPASFNYTVSDGNGGLATAAVIIDLSQENTAPTINHSFDGLALEDEPLLVQADLLVATAIDPDGDALTLTSVNNAAHGAVALDADGSVLFTPNANYNGAATFEYTISDGNGGTVMATATLNVAAVNDGPVVSAALADATNEDAALFTANLLAGASDVDTSDVLSATDLVQTAGRTVAFTQTGNGISLDPGQFNDLAIGESETISFGYNVFDGTASVAQTLTLTIAGRNDGPVVSAALADATNEDGALFTADLLAGASDVDATDILSAANLMQTSGRTVAFAQTGNGFSLAPSQFNDLAIGESETISFGYNVYDGTAKLAQSLTLTVEGRNDGPVVSAALTGARDEDAALFTDDLLAGASDVDTSDVLTATDLVQTSGRTVAFAQTGNGISLDPSQFNDLAIGESETISFGYNVYDGTASVAQSLTLTVEGRNDGPVVSAALTGASDEDAALFTADLLAGASDVDATDVLSATDLVQTAGRSVAFVQTGNGFSLDPSQFNDLAIGESETISFGYNVYDGTAKLAQTLTLTIEGRNDGPLVSAALADATNEDAVLFTADLLAGASDVDTSDVLTATDLVQTSGRTVTFAQTGNGFSLDPAQFNDLAIGESETISFGYNVFDGTAKLAQTLTLTVEGRNDGPLVSAALADATNEDAALFTADLLAGASDVDTSDVLSATDLVQISGRTVAFAQTGNGISLDPSQFNDLAIGESETISFGYNVYDGTAKLAQTLTLTIEGRNDGPVVSAALADATNEDAALFTADLLAGASDVDTSDILSAADLVQTSGRTVVFAQTGNGLSLDPAQFNDLAIGESETISFGYNVYDGTASVAQTLTLTVEGRNDGPVAVADMLGTMSAYEARRIDIADLLANDSDADRSDTMSLISIGNVVNGWAVLTGDGGILVQSHLGQIGAVSFDYAIGDGHGGFATATAQLNSVAPGNLTLGSSRNDRIYGTRAGDLIDSANGNDLIRASGGNDTLVGGAGNDALRGDDGNDLFLIGGTMNGIDSFEGGRGYDRVLGTIGDDTLMLREFSSSDGIEEIDGGLGVNLILGTSGEDELDFHNTLLNNIALIDGGLDDDEITGSRGADLISGGSGDDELYGYDGNDILSGGDGRDEIDGGNGDDSLYGEAGNDELSGGQGNDTLQGEAGDDRLYGESGDDILNGGEGNDYMNGGGGRDALFGGDGDDQLVGGTGNDILDGGSGDDYLNGCGGSDVLRGGEGNDRLTGSWGNDLLEGGAGNDTLSGGGGNDTLAGGTGNDRLIGGSDANTYQFDRGDGQDTVFNDSRRGDDRLVFGADIDANQLWFSRSRSDLVISVIGTGDKVVVDDWYHGRDHRVASLETASGQTLLDSQVDNLVSAMAAFAAPGMGQTTFPQNYQDQLAPIIAANWHAG